MRNRDRYRVAYRVTSNRRRKAIAPCFVLSVLSAHMGAAFAQAAPAQAASAPASTSAGPASNATAEMDTVTISATRRRELIREVPLAITAISTQRLAESGAANINDYLAGQPGIVLQNSTGYQGGGSLVIRGLTTGSDERPLSVVYVDDVPIGPTAFNLMPVLDLNLLDLDRLEILRGPQGTLYGASSMGGLLKYVTAVPSTYEFGGKAGISLSNPKGGGLNIAANGVINVPLKEDVAAVRIAAFGSRDGGYIDTTGPGGEDRSNRGHTEGARIAFALTPTRDLSLKLAAMTQKRHFDGGVGVPYSVATGQPIDGQDKRSALNVREPFDNQLDLYTLTVDYDLRWARFASITSHQRYVSSNDADSTAAFAFFNGPPFNGPPFNVSFTTATAQQHRTLTKNTQEFRLVSQTGGTIDWLAGLYYSRDELTEAQVFVTNGAGPLGNFATANALSHAKDLSAYGDITWNVTKDFGLTAGARVARVDVDFFGSVNGFLVDSGIIPQPAPVSTSKETKETYLLAAKYKLTPTSNVYARAASGYRPGGGNSFVPVGAPPTYKSDSLWTYEAGYKAVFPEARASLEVAVFQSEWSKIQQTVQVPGFTYRDNLGKARVRGLEAFAAIDPITPMTVSATLGLLDAKLLDAVPALGVSADARLPSSPRFTASASARYRFDLGDRPSFAAMSVNHVGNRIADFSERPTYASLPSYTQIDLSGGVKVGRADVSLFVRNVTDKRGVLGLLTNSSPAFAVYTPPRTVGINLSTSF